MSILKIQQLEKRYGRIKAIDQLSLQVEKGQIFGLLGPNGSGKTTTLGIVLDILKKDGGSYEWFDGQYGKNARRNIGALLETPNFYPYLNADENLAIIAKIKRKPQKDFRAILELVNLYDRRLSPFKTYSLGMKQRLAIGAALVGDPEILILDEPSNGLDPNGIAEVRTTIQRIAEAGKTILMASHILAEVEKVCTHVAIIKKGKLLATGPVGAIINNEITVEAACANNEKLRSVLSDSLGIKNFQTHPRYLLFQVAEDFDIASINQIAFQNKLIINHLRARKKSLEAEFLEITS